MKTPRVYVPTAEEDVVGPDHGQGEQVVHVLELEVVHVPQDKLPPGLPLFLTLPVTSKLLHLLGQSSVLLDEILHVGRHVAPLRTSQQRQLPVSQDCLRSRFSAKRVSNSATQRR